MSNPREWISGLKCSQRHLPMLPWKQLTAGRCHSEDGLQWSASAKVFKTFAYAEAGTTGDNRWGRKSFFEWGEDKEKAGGLSMVWGEYSEFARHIGESGRSGTCSVAIIQKLASEQTNSGINRETARLPRLEGRMKSGWTLSSISARFTRSYKVAVRGEGCMKPELCA